MESRNYNTFIQIEWNATAGWDEERGKTAL